MNLQDRLIKFRKLPENIQDLLLSEEHHLFLDNVAKAANLNQNQRYLLSYAVTTIFLKEVLLSEVPQYLEKELAISKGQAFKISQLLHENIFNKYKDYFATPPLKEVAKALTPENKTKKEKPVPRLEGNIVDLRNNKT